MKRLLLLTVFIFAIGITYAQDVQTTKDEELSSVQIVNTVFDRTTEAVSELAASLKVPAEHVYTILVRQQLINSIQLVIVFALLFIISYLMIKLPYNDWRRINLKWWKEHRSDSDNYYNKNDLDDGWWIWCVVPGVALAMIAAVCFIGYTGDIVTGFINPEYGAIKEIMSIL
jgi:hypothetical protein